MNKDKKRHIIHYIIICIGVFFQYGFLNITRLGFVTDDWAFTHYNLQASYSEIFNQRFDKKNIGYEVARPLNLFTSTFQLFLFKDSPVLNHLWQLVLIVTSMLLLYELLIKIVGSGNKALLTVLVFIVLPYNSSFYYWLSSRISIYAFILSIVSIIFLFSKNKFIKNILGPLLLLLAISGYEIFLVFIVVVFYLLFFTSFFRDYRLISRFTTFFSYLFFSSLIFIFKAFFRNQSPQYAVPHKVYLDLTVKEFNRFYTMVSSVLGPNLFKFYKDAISNSNLIYELDSWSFLLVALIILSLFLVLSKHNLLWSDNNLSTKQDTVIFQLGFVLITFGMLSLLPSAYNFSIGTQLDRVNLPVSLGISLVITYVLLRTPKFISNIMLFIVIIFMTSINWVFLISYIKSYEYQLCFIEYVKDLNIPENSLIFMETDLDKVNEIPSLDTWWGITGIIRYATGKDKLEYIGDWDSSKGIKEGESYPSRQFVGYVYENPARVFIKFNEKDSCE